MSEWFIYQKTTRKTLSQPLTNNFNNKTPQKMGNFLSSNKEIILNNEPSEIFHIKLEGKRTNKGISYKKHNINYL